MKILYCGFGRAGLECLYTLMAQFSLGTQNILVFTHQADGNQKFLTHLQNNSIRYSFQNVNDSLEAMQRFQPDYLISVYYRNIIKPNILNIVNYRAMNLHPSLLPLYKGTKSSVWAILNNETTTGITFHYINDDIDEGNIILQRQLSIKEEDTAYLLYHKLISLFALHIKEAFQMLRDGYPGKSQEGTSSYYPRKLPFGGLRKFEEVTYQEACQFTKAMYFPPHKGALFQKPNGERVEIRSISELNQYKPFMRNKE